MALEPPEGYLEPPDGYMEPPEGYLEPPEGYMEPPEGAPDASARNTTATMVITVCTRIFIVFVVCGKKSYFSFLETLYGCEAQAYLFLLSSYQNR